MAESIIKVIVSDQVSGSGAPSDVSVVSDKKQVLVNNRASSSNSKFSKKMIGAYQVVKTVSNQILANVGTYTGDSKAQTKINNIQTAVGLGIIAYMSPTAALTTAAISTVSTVRNEIRRQKMEDISLYNQRAKNGYSDSKSILISRRH